MSTAGWSTIPPGVADPRAQVITAAGQGSTAAIALNADLVDEDVERALANHRTGHTARPA